LILIDAGPDLPHWVTTLLGGGGSATALIVGLFLSRRIVMRQELDAADEREKRAIKERDEWKDISERAVRTAQDANLTANESMGLLRRLAAYIEGGTRDAAHRDGGKR